MADGLENDIVIVNLLNHESHKMLNDYLLKISSILFPNSTPLKRKLCFVNPKDRNQVDKAINLISQLIDGTSNVEHCLGRQFNWEQIHFKGLQHLDDQLVNYFYTRLINRYGDEVLAQRRINLDFFSLQTSDNAVLDSVAVTTQLENDKPITERRFIIMCLARDQNYINWLNDAHLTAHRVGCTVICFNYRGVCYSKGLVWTQTNMISDTLSQVDRLLALGVKAENIGLEGMCIGGAIATLAAAKLHARSDKVKLYNERSFRSLPRFISGYILPETQKNVLNPLLYLRYTFALLIYLLTTPIVWLAGWRLDAASAWDRIPFADKDYSVIHSSLNGETQDDGIIHYGWASIASLVKKEKSNLRNKMNRCHSLSRSEQDFLWDEAQNHQFKIVPQTARNIKIPHFASRRQLIATRGDVLSATNHAHMIDSFKQRFGLNSPNHNENPASQAPSHESKSIPLKRPLIISSSGGAGHISAALGLIDHMQKTVPELQVTQHRSRLYQHCQFSTGGLLIRSGVRALSIKGFGGLLKKMIRVCGYPSLPKSGQFFHELKNLENAEMDKESFPVIGRVRPYLDILLDIYPAGYEYAAIYNTLQKANKYTDIQLMLNRKQFSEKINYKPTREGIFKLLVQAAERGQAYTEIISTQPLSLKALCDAVKSYNQNYLPSKNRTLKNPLPTLYIQQYITDLPSKDCRHFFDALNKLTPNQQQQIHLYGLNLNTNLRCYLTKEQNFRRIHIIHPQANPMVRSGFKDPMLIHYLDNTKAYIFLAKDYLRANKEWMLKENMREIIIPADKKVAVISIGSRASIESVEYIEPLLAANYDKIIVFGANNEDLFQRLNRLIKCYPHAKREIIRKKIEFLGKQSDVEMAPILTRSDCTIIGEGGLSTMEQMALPISSNKSVFIHSNNNNVHQGWEAANSSCLIHYLQDKGVNAKKISPKNILNELNLITKRSSAPTQLDLAQLRGGWKYYVQREVVEVVIPNSTTQDFPPSNQKFAP